MDPLRHLQSLLDASAILHSCVDFKTLLRKMMDLIAQVMESEEGAIYLLDPATEEWVTEATQKQGPESDLGLRVKVEADLKGFCAGRGVPVLVEDARQDPRAKSGGAPKGGLPKSVLCVPMHYGGRMLGVLEVVNKKGGRPFDQDDLKLFQGLANISATAVANTRRVLSVETENRKLKGTGGVDLIGNAPSIQKILAILRKVAPTPSTVLLTGESGTGKEVVARALHALSDRKEKPFLPLNCGALPETLLESELFGHERGAFTGADRERRGLFEEADQGTVFLDEIGETSPATQVKLLRVLQEGKVKRLGSNRETQVNVRIIAATNQALETLIAEKKFREDLYYRLKVVSLRLPPLRERKEDIPVLAEYFLRKAARRLAKDIKGWSPQALRRLYDYEWKGNVRELENAVEAAAALCEGPILEPGDLPDPLRGAEAAGTPGDPAGWAHLTYDEANERFEKLYFGSLLASVGGKSGEAAKRSGVSEKSIVRRKHRFGW